MSHRAIRKFSIGLGRVFRIRTVRRITRQEDGVAAIEFGLVVAPFLALLFAIIETALVFFAGQTLETATADASRMLLTGQGVNFSATDFRTEVCKRIHALFDCQGKAIIDVRTYPTNSAGKVQKPIKDGKLDPAFSPQFQKSNAEQIVVVRVMYKWPVYVSLLGLNLSDIGGGERLLFSSAAFRNEPFQ